jgi:signal transduction histidine kinase
MLPLALHAALFLSFAESLGLASLLAFRLRGVTGGSYLILFLLGVAAWIAGCELPSWFGPGLDRPAAALIALSPLTSAVFLHFVLVFCRAPSSRPAILLSYLLAGLTGIAALIWTPGEYVTWAGIDRFFMPNAMGWVVGTVWAALAIAGHGVMALTWLRVTGLRRRQLMALCLASSWGALCMIGYGFHPLGIEIYPYPLLLLPAYPLILVYGILRYQLMIVNAWARRGLAWTLLVGLGSAIVIGLAALPLPFGGATSGWRLWAVAVATLLASGLLLDPFRRLATRLVYPGSHLAEGDVEQWRSVLAQADSFATLGSDAARAISSHLHLTIDVRIGVDPLDGTKPDAPLLLTRRDAERWRTELLGWEAAPPGPRHVAQLFGAVLAEAAQRLEQSMALAGQERERQQKERLAELGALAATVAHDIRNPLNIIAMAAATAPPEVRREIADQTARISLLASDLLDYAKSWQIERKRLDLADQIRAAATRYPEIELDPRMDDGLLIEGDGRRLGQIFVNLFENARAASQAKPAQIAVETGRRTDGAVEVHVCDNGAGISGEIRETLFQPFVSRSANGTGLGLAIVAKVMEAHGGSVRVTDRAGWTTCFTLTFPQAAAQ